MHHKVPPFNGNFPTDIYVADLKPLGIGKIGEGLQQIQNYLTGFRNFAARAKKDNVTAAGDPANITGHGLDVAAKQGSSTTSMYIPHGLDYRNVDNPREDRRKDREEGAVVRESIRYWLVPMPERGMYIHFHLAHPSPRDPTAADILGVIEGVDPTVGMRPQGSLKEMKGEINKPHPPMPNGIDLSAQLKPRPGARPEAVEREEDDENTATPVQRKELSPPKQDWKKLGKEWEANRDRWKKHKAKPFLETKSGAALKSRNEVDDKLGTHRSKPPEDKATLLKQVEQISLWSSVTGEAIGRIRFALGDKFSDVAAFLERIRNRFKEAHGKASTAQAPGRLGGWKKRLFYRIAVAVKTLLATFLTGLFDKLGNCINGIIMELISEFTQDISETLKEKLEGIEKYVDEQRNLLAQEFEEHFGKVEEAIEAIRKGQKIVGIITDAVTGIRLAVQLVACLTPPGLGCLWGLLGQLGVSAALDLIVGTQAFNDKVVNPALAKIFGDSLNNAQKKIIAALIPTSLEPYAKDPACGSEAQEPFVPQLTDGIASESELKKLRERWQAENEDQLIREIQYVTHNGEGKTPTREEVLEVAEALTRSGLTVAELQKAAQATPRDGSGLPILDAFHMQVDEGMVEKAAPSGPEAPTDPSQRDPSGPSISIRKRLNRPAPHVGPTPGGPQVIVPLDKERQIEIGPKILPPVVPGEDPTIGGGATLRF